MTTIQLRAVTYFIFPPVSSVSNVEWAWMRTMPEQQVAPVERQETEIG